MLLITNLQINNFVCNFKYFVAKETSFTWLIDLFVVLFNFDYLAILKIVSGVRNCKIQRKSRSVTSSVNFI